MEKNLSTSFAGNKLLEEYAVSANSTSITAFTVEANYSDIYGYPQFSGVRLPETIFRWVGSGSCVSMGTSSNVAGLVRSGSVSFW